MSAYQQAVLMADSNAGYWDQGEKTKNPKLVDDKWEKACFEFILKWPALILL